MGRDEGKRLFFLSFSRLGTSLFSSREQSTPLLYTKIRLAYEKLCWQGATFCEASMNFGFVFSHVSRLPLS